MFPGPGGPRSQSDQSCRRLSEAAGIEVERTQVFFEVDMQPLTLCSTASLSSCLDQRGSHPVRTVALSYDRVQDERMDAAVPGDVNEADQAMIFPGTDPAEAVTLKPCTPVRLSDRMTEPFGMQLVES